MGAGASMVALLAPIASAAAIYCGGGRGPTAEMAIQTAIWDAQSSAEGDGLFTCTLADEPKVAFIQNDAYGGSFWRASVNMSCS
ncbi:MAG: hypothetical protein ACRDMY_07510 [Gaiellaceae bacterium]